jgi:hypothetical protein
LGAERHNYPPPDVCFLFATLFDFSGRASHSCIVSLTDREVSRHGVEVEADRLFEAAVLGVSRLNADPWLVGEDRPTVLEGEVREPAAKHAASLQLERRLASGTTPNPNGAMRREVEDAGEEYGGVSLSRVTIPALTLLR